MYWLNVDLTTKVNTLHVTCKYFEMANAENLNKQLKTGYWKSFESVGDAEIYSKDKYNNSTFRKCGLCQWVNKN
jgi:hypothetical protein